jgi:hypothetical protein
MWAMWAIIDHGRKDDGTIQVVPERGGRHPVMWRFCAPTIRWSRGGQQQGLSSAPTVATGVPHSHGPEPLSVRTLVASGTSALTV